MAKITTAAQLAAKAVEVAKKHKTLYIMGCFGAPMNSANKARYCKNHTFNIKPERTSMIKAATADTFGFDCVCLIKGLLWGWEGEKNKIYGGASYNTNGVPDIGADAMIKVCKELSTDFSKIEVGEAVWTDGHIGIYVGDGLAVECTPAWKNCVQLTACNCTKSGYPRRNWKKHGKLPYVSYTGIDESEAKKENASTGAAAALSFKVGDVVNFTGTTHYNSAAAKSGLKCKGGKAKVTAISKGAKHPYHLIAVSGSGSTVYGWVDADEVKKVSTALSFKVGDVVNFTGTTHYNSAAAKSGLKCKGGKAKVTAISKGAKHPYHLIAVSGSGSTVYGWVDADEVKRG